MEGQEGKRSAAQSPAQVASTHNTILTHSCTEFEEAQRWEGAARVASATPKDRSAAEGQPPPPTAQKGDLKPVATGQTSFLLKPTKWGQKLFEEFCCSATRHS